jgi:recombination protein RecA
MTLPQLHIVLPERLQRFLPAARRGLAFGIPALDALLPFGLPRGQITALDAPLGSGGTALLFALAEATLRADEGVAFVDAARTLAPQGAAHLAGLGPFWVIRPRGTESAWWCADVLLRTGAFGLVVVDQAPAPSRTVAVRLQRLARDKDAVLVVRETGGRADERTSGPAQSGAALAPREHKTAASAPGAAPAIYGASVRLRVRASPSSFLPAVPGPGAAWPGPRGVKVTLEKGGAPRAAEVPVGAPLPYRLRPHWAVRDRRGEPTGGRRSLSGRGQRPRAARPDWPAR